MTEKTKFTTEQLNYIEYKNNSDTKLIACAGSGKSTSVVNRMNYIIENKMLESSKLLMLTFSRFTRDDFIHKIKKMQITSIQKNQIKTIDSFAKTIIDPNNEIDISLLSYKLMKYLEAATKEEVLNNEKLNLIKCIFVDEAQDLNEIQYKILINLKEKNNTVINLIGDPNQNIYQFRKSSDKFLVQFQAETFYLTKNFRSYNPIIEFSKHLRPVKDLDVEGQLGQSDCLPNFIFHENDTDLEKYLVTLIFEAKKSGVDYSEIAILSPTRGRMMGHGRSHGLCFISNLLYKNKIKFKQFYEEALDNEQSQKSGVKYCPEIGYINLLTYMGSKGLEWKCVILVDADVCLINKRHFSDEKHKADQYLLYVACSRAINNMVIFSKYRNFEGNFTFQLNPWFDLIPKKCYSMDQQLQKFFKYPNVNPKNMSNNENKTTKLLDRISEELLDELSMICKYKKTIEKIYDKDFSVTITSNVFLGKYVENLFSVYYAMDNIKERKKYIDIENIINKSIITNVSITVNEWFYRNREHLTWEKYEHDKLCGVLDKLIIDTVDQKFNKAQPLKDHTIVNDGYFKAFILSLREKIEENYKKYLATTSTKKIKKYLFDIMVILYSLNTQHYFHALNNGKKFKNMLVVCDELFDSVKNFAYTLNMNFTQQNVLVEKDNLIGEIDLLTNTGEIWEIKCTADITLKHLLQVLMYNLLQNDYTQENSTINVNFINFLKGEKNIFTMDLTQKDIARIKEIITLNLGT